MNCRRIKILKDVQSSPEWTKNKKWTSKSLQSQHSNNDEDVDNLSNVSINSEQNVSISKKVKKRKKTSTRHLFDHSTPSTFLSALSMGVGLDGGLTIHPNTTHLNIHKYHRSKIKSDDKRLQRQKMDESIYQLPSHDNHEQQYRNTRDDGYISFYRKRAKWTASESSPSLSSRSIANPQRHRTLSKDDLFHGYDLNNFDYAGMKNKRITRRGALSRKSRNSSPRMTQTLFDLSNIKDFVTTKESTSVVTNSFAATHDHNYQTIENYF